MLITYFVLCCVFAVYGAISYSAFSWMRKDNSTALLEGIVFAVMFFFFWPLFIVLWLYDEISKGG
jgi:hypothetical protein